MTVKQLVNLTYLNLKVVVSDGCKTYELDDDNFNCPLNDYSVFGITVKDDKLYVTCVDPKQVYAEEEEYSIVVAHKNIDNIT